MKQYLCVAIVVLLLHSLSATAQAIPATDSALKARYPFMTVVNNTISNDKGLDSFYKKLVALKKTHKGVVRIVHIGDSHIQADIFSGTMRNKLQRFFGSAGRGLVFPYQLARSNAPVDISSSSNITWHYNRLAHPEIPITSGIAGFCIKTDTAAGVAITISVKPGPNGSQSFDHLQFFLDSTASSPAKWELKIADKKFPLTIKKDKSDSAFSREIFLQKEEDSFSITSSDTVNTKQFFGVSLENSNAGILYHTIGVNGATYNEYNIAPLFWQQLGALDADLYIISLGTNEAQKPSVDETAFQQQVLLFIQKIKAISPNAAIIITTAADSYKTQRSNVELEQVNCLLSLISDQNNIPLWDMYNITGGHQSADCWRDNKCMNKDLIHYLPDGYQLQGELFFNAVAKGYNNYINNQ
ncbi:MAG TPA: GDSL-type esterase/lipase family protein [Ferruginibacter sp.]|nr:GDSL-type esterase/lipase family protein [Ferruginibacter sp.]